MEYDIRRFNKDVMLVRRALEPGGSIDVPSELAAARARLSEVSGLYVIEAIIKQKATPSERASRAWSMSS